MQPTAPDEHYRALIRAIPGTFVAVFDRDLRLAFVDGAAPADAEHPAPGSTLEAFVPPDRVTAALACARQALSGLPQRLDYEDPDGQRSWAVDLVPYRPDDRAIHGLVWVARDVSARKATEEQLTHRALHDPLTGAANRDLFMDRLQRALARLDREPSWLAVIFIDLDRLKAVNDTLGHAAGDHVLVQVVRRIRRALRPTDTVARLGGDEFVVLCEDLPEQGDAEAVARRIGAAVALPVTVEAEEVQMTASIGVRTTGEARDSAAAILRDADAAMYRAKRRGRGAFALFEDGMRMAPGERARVESALRRALADGQLMLLYQPQVRLGDMTTVGAEALLRWRHPVRGVVAPGEFLLIAEDAGLIGEIGDWVLGSVCADIARWPEHMQASINLSAAQLTEDLVERTLVAVERAGIAPARLCFEISEMSLATQPERGAAALSALGRSGFAVAIDDFGVGFSSLQNLRRLPPVDRLGLDRTFVGGLGTSDRDAAIVASVILLTNALGMSTLGEGIENEAQAECLRDMGCDFGQGFWLGRPQPVESLLAHVAAD